MRFLWRRLFLRITTPVKDDYPAVEITAPLHPRRAFELAYLLAAEISESCSGQPLCVCVHMLLSRFLLPPLQAAEPREPLEPSLTFLPAKQHKALGPLGHNRKLGLDKQDPIKERTGASPLLLGSGINI